MSLRRKSLPLDASNMYYIAVKARLQRGVQDFGAFTRKVKAVEDEKMMPKRISTR